MAACKRRVFIKQGIFLVTSALITYFAPKSAYAVAQTVQFKDERFSDTLNRLFTNRTIIDSDQIKLSLPETAENGAVVPIFISSELENISRLYLLVEKNPVPLAAEFELSGRLSLEMSARIKMAESCNVVIVAEQGSQLLKNQRWVNVVIGGCGTG